MTACHLLVVIGLFAGGDGLSALVCLFSRCAPYAPSYISYDDSSHSPLDFLLGRSTTGVACLIPS